MFCTKNYATDIKDVPSAWVFSHYGNVPIERFNGDSFKVNSIFNPEDHTPSLSFYAKDIDPDDKTNIIYNYNDFSTGKKGSCVGFVVELFRINYAEAYRKIVDDYNVWISQGGIYVQGEIVVREKYKVTEYKTRGWSSLDAKFWTAYNIGSKLLARYNVKALSYYTMSRGDETFTVSGNHIYGYFTQEGLLYKIYQPFSDQKFIKVNSYIQGTDQVNGHRYLIYLSSLKDLMSFESLCLKMDTKAPDSENTLIPQEDVEMDIDSYHQVLVLFDTDKPGVDSANLYKEKYGIEPIFLNYGEKDLSDHFKRYGPNKVGKWLIPLIHKKINHNKWQQPQ